MRRGSRGWPAFGSTAAAASILSGNSRPSPSASSGGQNSGSDSLPPNRRGPAGGDRKSTRLNSSHGCISYAVFFLEIMGGTILIPFLSLYHGRRGRNLCWYWL